MDSTRMQRGTKQTSTRYQAITDEEMLNEGDYDDVWPSRPASSARRYRADVRTEMGHTPADVLTGSRRAPSSAGERRTIPPRRTATHMRIPSIQAPSTEEHPRARHTDEYQRVSLRGRFHALVFVGLAMLAILTLILSWLALNAIGNWWQVTQDDWHYGRPRTFQTDQVVGHHDSAQNPSHFIAMNLNRHIIIIEIPGGDVAKSVVFNGPTLVGPGQDLTAVTLTFQDVNHDGRPDMLLNIQGNQLVYLNENGTFVTPGQNQNTGG